MDKFVIHGGKKLSGETSVSGAKNSALVLMPATLLTSGINVIENTPEVNDIYTMIKLLNQLGVESEFVNNKLTLNTGNIISQTAPYEHVKKMRASVYVLGPFLARYGKAKVSMPGGCAWGPRPINLHLEAMKKLGAYIQLQEGYIIARANKLHGAKIHFDISSVGATGNTMMAASLANGTSILTNAAIEPEITLLAQYLCSMGAIINGIGTTSLEIQGVDELKPANITNISDRIEAGTLMIAGAITKSKIKLTNLDHNLLDTVLIKLEDSGVKVSISNNLIDLDATGLEPESIDVTTAVYPGFPTDMQAQWTAFMSLASGIATVTDSIYHDRFNHIPELVRLGANIEVINNSAVVKGVKLLRGAKVMSTDLRASASIVLAGLAAEGITEVLRIYHLDRGYQKIEEKLRNLGADILRETTSEF